MRVCPAVLALLFFSVPMLAAQTSPSARAVSRQRAPLPSAPLPNNVYPVRKVQNTWVAPLAPPLLVAPCTLGACVLKARQTHVCCQQSESRFRLYLHDQATHIYTPRELAVMAARDVVDPFNLLTIEGLAAIDTAASPHSIFGPGMKGFAKLSGVSITEDMTDEFVGTFLIPSIDHQDPHYHRMPNKSIPKRVLHTITQVFWTRSDTDRPMFNYSNVVGSMAEEAVATTYVPYQQTGWGAAAERVSLNYAFDPIGNMVTEFLPDVAKHVNFHVVFVQQIIYRAALSEMQ
jgi:hypothetical protein